MKRARNLGRFEALLVALVLFLVLAPFAGEERIGLPRYSAYFTLVMVAGVYAVSQRRRVLWAGLVLAVPAIALQWASVVATGASWAVAHAAASVIFLGYVISVLMGAILHREEVTRDTIFGGICVYLLIGVLWSDVYQCLEVLEPGSFDVSRVGPASPVAPAEALRFVYFSFVTLTTLGYGEIVPATPQAQALVVLEAVTGPLFLAVFIARLVGLHMAGGRIRRD